MYVYLCMFMHCSENSDKFLHFTLLKGSKSDAPFVGFCLLVRKGSRDVLG